MVLESSNNNSNFRNNFEDEIDLKPLFNILNRGKIFISSVSIISILITFLIIFFSKRQWSGEFEIVLRTIPNITNTTNLSNEVNRQISPSSLFGKNDLIQNTQLNIIQSPSVLLEVFDFVKTKKVNTEKFNELKFTDWEKQLKFEKIKKTLVLKLSYSDEDKSLINPVLNRISNVYQKYSGKNRQRQIELGKQFFSGQIDLYQEKSSESSYKAQQFANRYNLTVLKSSKLSSTSNTNEILNIPNSDFNITEESELFKAKNDIKVIEKQIDSIKSNNIDSSKIIYLASNLIPKRDFDVGKEMMSIEIKIKKAMDIYRKDDKAIKDLFKEKRNLINATKSISLSILNGMKDEAKNRLKTNERPEGVFAEYRKLLDISERDRFTLKNLYDGLRQLSLEEARDQDPWELITEPTLLPNPVPRNTISKSLLAGLVGFIGSCFYLIYKNNRKGLISSFNQIKSIVNCDYHESLLRNNQNKWDETLEFFLRKTFLKSSENLAFFIVGNINQSERTEILNKINKLIPKAQFKICESVTEIFDYSSFVIITSVGVTKKNELEDLNQKLIQLNKSITSCLSIS